MRVLVLGSGGREHALAWKISQSPSIEKIWCAPGNPGTALVAENVAVAADDIPKVVSAALELKIDLVVVGPEGPLVKGVADALRAKGIATFGPSGAAAALEGSKAFAKEVMAAAQIPTAKYRSFTSSQLPEAEAYARAQGKIVVKADGLAAGKGVVVAITADEAVQAVRSVGAMGEAAKTLVLEELLQGEEVSAIALCDGERYQLLPPAQDHKRIFDGDQGPNTGGMGAYAPAPVLTPSAADLIGVHVVSPTLKEMKRRGTPFSGALFVGLMITRNGPRVLEFNCRFGDPETQALMMQLDEDLLPLLAACARGQLPNRSLKLHSGASIGVVMAAHGYPGTVRSGDAIVGIDAAEGQGARVFHAGTKRVDGKLVASGGRVLTVCAQGSDLRTARERAYRAVEQIRFDGAQYRRDIGARGLERR